MKNFYRLINQNKKTILTFPALIMSLLASKAQITPCYDDDPKVQGVINKADSLFFEGRYKESVLNYSQVVKKKYDQAIYLNICRAYLKLQDKGKFINALKKMTDAGFRDYWIIDIEPDFLSLSSDKVFQSLQERIKENYKKHIDSTSIKYPDIAAKLFKMSYEDQQYQYIRILKAKYKNAYPNYTSADLSELVKGIFVKNNQLLKKIIEEFGFLGRLEVGAGGSKTCWLIVQHSDFDRPFQSQYLKLMKVAVNNNNASPQDYAYLLDRVKKGNGEKQVYGTQVVYFTEEDQLTHKKTVKLKLWQVEDESKLNDLRKEIGLPPIEEYLEMLKKMSNAN